MQLVQVGPLIAALTPSLKPEDVKRTIVLLHGYGAPGTDLVGLSTVIAAPPGTQFVFLMAPHTLDGQSGMHAGRAWWHIDMIALQVARMTGQNDMLARQVPEGLEEARDVLSEALLVLEKNHGLAWEETYLGGFSQGAMLSMDMALRSDKPLKGILQLSGTMICEDEWPSLMKKRAGTRVFQSHSPDDQVLPLALAERLRDRMTEAGMVVDFVRFRGGHGIPGDVISRLSSFISVDS
jgi:phospholipase/carboxylesterase